MDNSIMFKLELNTAATKVFSQVMISQEMVREQMEAGIKKAIEGMDLEELVAHETKSLIQKAIQESLWNGGLKELVKDKLKNIVDSITEKEVAHWTAPKTNPS